ncbi:MAG: amino acid ABC transporter permease [Chloroflexi bacterium]|nr:amino acid ABC transporter permease [Chloroflexota bacterium]
MSGAADAESGKGEAADGPGPDADGHRPGVLIRRPRRGDPVVAVSVAVASTVLFFGAIAWAVVTAPDFPRVQRAFLNGPLFEESLPEVVRAFQTNIKLFLIAEVLVLFFGLVLAVMRSLPGPVFFPLRLLAVAYTDLLRGLPGILVIFLLGFGVPGLNIEGVPNDPFFWAVVALTMIYAAYVSEVYRAGIESVHPSQEAAARSLGLRRSQALRYVILPQAVRRIVPPLLNDFLGLQKDTVLVSFIGVVEIFRASQIKQAGNFNFTPYLATALVFIVVTVPLARLTDYLVTRSRRGQARGGFR